MSRHSTSRIIISTPHAIFRAFVDPEVFVKWRVPASVDAKLLSFDPRVGGGYRMALIDRDQAGARASLTTGSKIIDARFVELAPDTMIVEAVRFEDDDAHLSGTMTITTTIAAVTGGTKVAFVTENVRPGISEADHKTGMEAALKNLANLLE